MRTRGGANMFRNLEAEQKRAGLSNSKMAEILAISRVTYENKKHTGLFNRAQIVKLLKLFNCNFEYLFQTDTGQKTA
jgi:hypothetical protein